MIRRRAATLAALAPALLGFATALTAAPIGAVKQVRGEVIIERGADSAAATVGDPLEEGDTVRTGPDSAVGLTLSDRSTYALGPESALAITRYLFRRGAGSRLRLRLDDGEVTVKSGAIAAQGPEAMTVQTPTTIVGVRGTYFIVSVEQ